MDENQVANNGLYTLALILSKQTAYNLVVIH